MDNLEEKIKNLEKSNRELSDKIADLRVEAARLKEENLHYRSKAETAGSLAGRYLGIIEALTKVKP